MAIALLLAACGDATTTPGHPTATSPPAPTRSSPELEVREVSDVVYQEDGDGRRSALNVYAPSTGGPWPVVVLLHAGLEEGFTYPDVARQGLVVFEPRTEDPDEDPDFPWRDAELFLGRWNRDTEKIACAVRFARTEAERYGGDPSTLTLFGHSITANVAAMVAFSDPEIPEGCLAPSGSTVPENLVLFDGPWIPPGLPSWPFWDDLLGQDSRGIMEAVTPWSHLERAERMPVHIIDSDDPGGYMWADEESLALRDPTGRFFRELDALGALDDETLTELELDRYFYGRLRSLGYRVSFQVLPDSTHVDLSEEGFRAIVDAIVNRT